jgi:prophage regulatory protein
MKNSPEISPNPERLIDKPVVLDITTFSDTTLWRRCKDGSFPAPVRISPGRVAWRASEVQGWMAERSTQKAV